nr:hypothetical protein GCM10023233_22510 [Brevibacterium otitidis]
MRRALAPILATTALLVLAGCSTQPGGSSASEPTHEQETSAVVTPAPAVTPAGPVRVKVGETVDDTDGGTLTAHEYRVVTDLADHTVGAIDIEVCVTGNPPAAAQDVTPYVSTEYWSVIDASNRHYGDPSTTWRHDEISPILDYETDASWGECVRGWALTEADADADVKEIRYMRPEYIPEEDEYGQVDESLIRPAVDVRWEL